MRYGYVRVSAKDQNPERQYIALENAGVEKTKIYIDRMSGKNFNRPEYKKLLRKLKAEDVFVIKSIDRLGRNYSEILDQWRIITREKSANIEVIDMPLLNTNTVHGDLTGKVITDIVLQLLAYVAETERRFIKMRQAEGIAAAKARGVKFGNSRKEIPDKFEQYYKQWEAKEITIREAAKKVGMNYTTFYRRCKEQQERGFNK